MLVGQVDGKSICKFIVVETGLLDSAVLEIGFFDGCISF